MNPTTIITCAITGSSQNFRHSDAVPITPAAIASSAIDAAHAGAAMVHIHVREPDTGRPSTDLQLYAEVVDRIRDDGVDVIVNLTTGYGARFVPGDDVRTAHPDCNFTTPAVRTAHITELRPEVCSLDVATFNFGDDAFVNTPRIVTEMARSIVAAGVLPELEVFEVGHLLLCAHLIETGVLPAPGHFQFCLGIKWAIPATATAIDFLRGLLPAGATWSAFGVSQYQFPMVAAAVEAGGHVRVGLEDNLYLSRGVLAPSNAALVERAARIVADLGSSVATPAQARAILGLEAR